MKKIGPVLLILLAGCAHAPARRSAGTLPQGVSVEAEGWSAVVSSDPLGTAKRALAEAQRKAVEEVVGVSLRARTRVEAAVSVEQKISADVAGRILSYDVLGEREVGGFHKTRIRAVVLKEPLQPQEGRPAPLPGDPRVAVTVDRREAEKGLQQALRDAGVSVGSGAADYVVKGEASVEPLDSSELEGFVSYRARLAVELRDPAKGALIASRDFEASGMDLSREAAAGKALTQAGRMAGEKLAADLRAWLEQ